MTDGQTRYPAQLDETDNLPSIVGYDMTGDPIVGGDNDPARNAENLLGVITTALLALEAKVGRSASTPANGYLLRGGTGSATTWTAPAQIAATAWGTTGGTAGQVVRVNDAGTALEFADVTPADGTVTNAKVADDAAIAESKLDLASDAAAGTPSRRTLGTGATQACAGNDSRLTNARPPTAHTASHATGGSDAIAPADIGAATTGAVTTVADALSSHAGTAGDGGHIDQQPAVADVSLGAITAPADSPVDADTLRDDLATGALADIGTALTALESTVNTILDRLRDSEVIAS
ncbi:hypothetical protein [Euzebya rosea]|uniref:hypothetical protein n=1 Tax=Euzebya rosea TaxID=2052804 RepID=UPI000D3E65F8|nr:hypothetical protein [Euzebya rosea]